MVMARPARRLDSELAGAPAGWWRILGDPDRPALPVHRSTREPGLRGPVMPPHLR
ncbi:MAG TPA: hypothetical protein VIA06_23435 [Candidatus Dormibacteraeota bacterium]|nr:hypothetical protein [Candidatus Dormibacteraeota bacterium]